MSTKTSLYSKSWDVDNPKAVILLVHGLGEHCNRYHALGDYLTKSGYSLTAIDLPGHGQSSGTPGHIDQFSDYHDAILHLHKKAKDKYPDSPLFLLGHSMGGLISAQFLLDHQDLFKGALLSGAAIETPQEPPAWQVSIINFISKILPNLGLIKLDASHISQDPSVVDDYMNDSLVYKGQLSARFIAEITKSAQDCKTRASNITLPIFIMHGGSDVITKPEGSIYLHQHISSEDKTLKIYDDLFHEIFNEPDAKSIYSDVVSWLNNQC